MPSHAQHAHAELHRRYWQRSILIPLWTQQFLLQLTGTIIFYFAVTIYWAGGANHGKGPKVDRREQAILGSFFVLYLSLLLATLGEVLLYCVNALQPKRYLISQLLKLIASSGVWATLIVYPYVIKNPIASRTQVAIGMEAIFAWLQIPMLSSLVHAGLVAREEWVIKRELDDRLLHASEIIAAAPAAEVAQSERTPLLATNNLGYGGRPRSRTIGGSRV
ncbi:hypothetical protein BT63DRAFT_226509 [Microthyrium microscopicum]|uniref:Uncharacterized protein n=1 Tax=Microthyrium microscopicum TaxID=703497 RepID=A0A6A6UDP5_9PEZI|nr:hypothetical protein BT63DRAFT_226509 [Microthyrium microscopicum]